MLFVQSEATAARRRFPIFLVDATDGITAETGEAGGQPQISKNGSGFTNTTATLTAIGNGSYYVELTATELDTAGDVIVRYKSANTAEFSLHGDVLSINVHDTVRMGLTALPNAAAEAAGGLYTRGTGAGQVNQDANGRHDVRVVNMATDVITAAATAADFTTEVAAPILAVLGALANAASSGDPNTSNTIVQMLKQLVNTLEGTAGIPTFPAAVVPGNAVSLAEAVRQIYTEVQNIDGASLANLDAAISSRASAAQATAIQADTDDIQTRLPAALVSGRMDSSVGAMAANVMTAAAADPTLANELADQVWDEALAGHLAAGSTGAALNGAGSAGDPWTTPLPGAYGAGTAGNILGSNLNATVGSRATQASVDSVQADTDNLQTRVPAALVAGRMDAHVGSLADGVLTAAKFAAGAFDGVWTVLTRTLTSGANIVLAKGTGVTGLNDLSAAAVKAEVVDALATDVYPEPATVPAAGASLAAKIGWLQLLARNRVLSTATQIVARNDADTAAVGTATKSDDAVTYVRGEFT